MNVNVLRWAWDLIAVLLLLLPPTPQAYAQAPRLPKVYSAHGHGLIVLPSGVVKVFGRNEHGELGLGAMGNPQYSDELIDLPGVYDAVDGAVGGDSAFVLRADGDEVPVGSRAADRDLRVPFPATITRVKAVSAGGGYALALMNDGTVRVWGNGGDHNR